MSFEQSKKRKMNRIFMNGVILPLSVNSPLSIKPFVFCVKTQITPTNKFERMRYVGSLTQHTKDYHFYHNLFCSSLPFSELSGKLTSYKMYKKDYLDADSTASSVKRKTEVLFGFRVGMHFDSPYCNETISELSNQIYSRKHGKLYLRETRIVYNPQVEMYFSLHEIGFSR